MRYLLKKILLALEDINLYQDHLILLQFKRNKISEELTV
jgi:hypothetical protein